MKLLAKAGLVTLVAVPALIFAGRHADAHPLGNFSVNHYDGLHLHPDRIAGCRTVTPVCWIVLRLPLLTFSAGVS